MGLAGGQLADPLVADTWIEARLEERVFWLRGSRLDWSTLRYWTQRADYGAATGLFGAAVGLVKAALCIQWHYGRQAGSVSLGQGSQNRIHRAR